MRKGHNHHVHFNSIGVIQVCTLDRCCYGTFHLWLIAEVLLNVMKPWRQLSPDTHCLHATTMQKDLMDS